MARTIQTSGTHPLEVYQVREIFVRDVIESLRLGWRDFMIRPSSILFLFIIYPVIGVVTFYIAFNMKLIGLIYPLVAGFALVGPVAAVGVFELSRRHEAGEDPSLTDAFAVLSSPSRWAILMVSLLLFGLFAAWIVAAQRILDLTMGELAADQLDVFVIQALTTGQGLAMFVIGNAVGFLFAVAALTLGVVSLPLLVDGETRAGTALGTSIRAVVANPVPMAVWGLTVAVLLALGTLPVFAGLLIVLPVLGHANWHLYRKVVDR